MAEATSTTSAASTEGTGETQARAVGTPPGESAPTPAPALFTQADLDRIAGQARADERAKAQRAADLAEQQRKDAEAAAQGEWKTLAERGAAENALLKAQIAQMEHAALAARIAAKHALPPALAARLQGADEAALEADAGELAKLLKPAVAPRTEAGSGARPVGAALGAAPPKEDKDYIPPGFVAW